MSERLHDDLILEFQCVFKGLREGGFDVEVFAEYAKRVVDRECGKVIRTYRPKLDLDYLRFLNDIGEQQ
jgi:hypothetical protein